ncbi:MAG: hypothetical protein J2P22_04030 [Nocardioides sp.]|nr:hypothetical protein [Nocardioides sp.]
MSAPAWRITLDGKTAFVEGPRGSVRTRIVKAGDPSPVWVKRRDAWATSTEVARKVADVLDRFKVPYRIEDTAQLGLGLAYDETLDYAPPEPPTERPEWRGVRYGHGPRDDALARDDYETGNPVPGHDFGGPTTGADE